MAVMRYPNLSVTFTFSDFARLWLIRRWLVSAGAFRVEFSRTNQRPSVRVGRTTLPIATVVRVNNKNLVLSALDLTALISNPIHFNHFALPCQADETRVAFVRYPELAVTFAITECVVCITAKYR